MKTNLLAIAMIAFPVMFVYSQEKPKEYQIKPESRAQLDYNLLASENSVLKNGFLQCNAANEDLRAQLEAANRKIKDLEELNKK